MGEFERSCSTGLMGERESQKQLVASNSKLRLNAEEGYALEGCLAKGIVVTDVECGLCPVLFSRQATPVLTAAAICEVVATAGIASYAISEESLPAGSGFEKEAQHNIEVNDSEYDCQNFIKWSSSQTPITADLSTRKAKKQARAPKKGAVLSVVTCSTTCAAEAAQQTHSAVPVSSLLNRRRMREGKAPLTLQTRGMLQALQTRKTCDLNLQANAETRPGLGV